MSKVRKLKIKKKRRRNVYYTANVPYSMPLPVADIANQSQASFLLSQSIALDSLTQYP